MDVSLALTGFAGLLVAWISIGRRASRTPKLTILTDDCHPERSAA